MNTAESSRLNLIIKIYDKHRRFFYLDNYQNFKLFANWYLSPVGSTLCAVEGDTAVGTAGAQLPWYRRNYEVQELAKILKCSERYLLAQLAEIHNDYSDRNG